MRQFRSGYSLVVVMIYITLMVAFGVIVMPLLRSAVTSIEEARRQTALFAATDHLLGSMRADVWDADAVSCPDDQTLLVTTAGATPVRWTFGGATVRRQSAEYPVVATRLHVTAAGSSVHVTADGLDVTLTAPRLLLRHAS